MTITAMYQSLPEHHPIFAQIGRVASAWAHFEQELDQSIIAISGSDERSLQCVLTQFISSAPRIRAFTALCREKNVGNEAWFKSASLFLQKNNSVAEKRNRVVHDPWMIDTVSNTVFQRSVLSEKNTSRLDMRLVARDEEQLVEVIRAIDKHVLRYRALCDDLGKISPEVKLNIRSSLTYVTRSIDPAETRGGSFVTARPATKEELASMLALRAAQHAEDGL